MSVVLGARLLCASIAVIAVQAPAPKPSPVRVLFIGNSLTSENDLPAMIEAIAVQAGLEDRVICRAVAKPNYGLEEHWKDGDAVRAIQAGHWTHIVLQQGPSSLPESERILRDYTKRFGGEARRRGAEVLLYSVWPPRARFGSLDAVTASYAHAAREIGGTLVPVGEGWRAAWRRDPSLPLCGSDGFHPSPLGTYLAALMFLERLAGVSPIGLSPPDASESRALRAVRVDVPRLSVLQAAAAEANRGQTPPSGVGQPAI